MATMPAALLLGLVSYVPKIYLKLFMICFKKTFIEMFRHVCAKGEKT